MNGFIEFGLRKEMIEQLAGDGIETPTTIQEKMIPPLLEGKDLLVRGRTGTGKTFGFLLPAVEMLNDGENRVKILVITPTRELAIQITEEVRKLLPSEEKAVAIYGGQDIHIQIARLKVATIAVGTPGRLLDHVRRGTIDLDSVSISILDEADQMLHTGFLPEVSDLMEVLPEDRQAVLCSATMPAPIKELSNRFLADPVECYDDSAVIPEIKQTVFVTKARLKQDTLVTILHQFRPYKAILFCRTKRRVARLAEALSLKGIQCGIFHGNLSQAKREQVVEQFRNDDFQFLIATDIAARGLDIDGVTHVINYDIPLDVEGYVHRIGRTARAGGKGIAVTIATPSEEQMLLKIEKSLQTRMKRKTL
ncbi:DEAD/DEAH box helicase [Alkalihalobacillus sp. R86527]|uniref:DEAD/DEAH box helicase n=1 Tax=Alkalihalobacillus sp. R86527 TaxID=3093863 RepID=UPI00366D44EB